MRKRKVKWLRLILFCFLVSGGIFGAIVLLETKMPHVLAFMKDEEHSLDTIPEPQKTYLRQIEKNQADKEAVKTMIDHYQDYPEVLLKTAANNPDTFAFVFHYPQKQNTIEETARIEDISTLPKLYQWDERWGYAPYGDGIIATTGCATTAFSMVVSYLAQDASLTPLYISRYAQSNGYYIEDAGTSWQLFHDFSAQLGLNCNDLALQQDIILQSLSMGHPVLASMGPGDFTTTGHLIVLSGIDEAGNVRIHDPNSRTRTNQTWNLERVISQMAAAWEFTQ